MDERYYSDRPRQTPHPVQPESEPTRVFRASPQRPAPQKEKFVVHLPDSEPDVPPVDRTPKGRPVAARSADPNAPIRMPEYTPKPVHLQQPRPVQPQPKPVQQRPVVQQRQTPPRPVQQQPRPVSQRPAAQQRPQAQNPAQRTNANSGAQRSGQPPRRPPKKKKRRAAKIILAVVCVLLVLIAGGLIYGYVTVGHLNYDKSFQDENSYMPEDTLESNKWVKNILFIGSDARDYDPGVTGQRSDTVILCSVDSRHHKVKLTSFLRDSYVFIPSKQTRTKLNAAFSYGGPQLLIDTLEYNFKVKIDGYVLINFDGFKKVIDLMGGLDVEGVTAAEAKYLRDEVKIIYAKEGTNHFSGAAALWYCRIRYLDNDFRRTERQRKVIGAIAKQAMHLPPTKLIKIINETMPMFTTSLSRNEVLPTALLAVFDYLGSDNPQHQVPAEGTWQNIRVNGAGAVLQFDEEENQRLLKEFIYE